MVALFSNIELSCCHNLTLLSRPAVAKTLPALNGAHEQSRIIRVCPFDVVTSKLCSFRSEMAQMRSRPTERIYLSSGDHSIAVIVKECAVSGVGSSLQFLLSYIL